MKSHPRDVARREALRPLLPKLFEAVERRDGPAEAEVRAWMAQVRLDHRIRCALNRISRGLTIAS